MSRFVIWFSPGLISILLGGCVSISTTDGRSLEISADGVQIIKGPEEVEDGEVREVEKLNVDAADVEKPEEMVTQEKEPDTPSKPDASEIAEGFGGYDNEFYLLQNRILADFQLTPCPAFKSIEINTTKEQRDVYASYDVFTGIYEEYDTYKAFFEKRVCI